ncbi:MAG: hypothetical protein IKG21_08535 [Atopobiaceae bacterium]|nr:hypothetical protein [Atopobiaceae bacterium]
MSGLKTERELRDVLSRRLARTFAEDVCGVEAAWPWTLHVGKPSSRELVRNLEALDVLIRALRVWEAQTNVVVCYEMREAGGPKRVPCRVEIPTADDAALLATPRKGAAGRTGVSTDGGATKRAVKQAGDRMAGQADAPFADGAKGRATMEAANRMARRESASIGGSTSRSNKAVGHDEQASARDSWPATLARARARRDLICEALPHVDAAACAKTVRTTDAWEDIQFELLLSAAAWFYEHDAHGLTPRQVPLPGIDAKWLDTVRNRQLVCLLSDKEELGLVGRPARLEFAYVDPTHAQRCRRRFDSWVDGDSCELVYEPTTCVIVENKDTYLSFPALEGGICVFGAGKAGMAVAATFPGVCDAAEVFYWGDLDADGFEILNGYRERGVACQSILMDYVTLERFERYGTSLEKDHRTPIERERKDLPHLTEAERAAYDVLTDPTWTGHRRIEQEKIPLDEAVAALRRR